MLHLRGKFDASSSSEAYWQRVIQCVTRTPIAWFAAFIHIRRSTHRLKLNTVGTEPELEPEPEPEPEATPGAVSSPAVRFESESSECSESDSGEYSV
jgi:hypothetical protein